VLYAILACACWGLSFVMPLFAPEFSATEITLGRYFFYGLFSLIVFAGMILRGRCRYGMRVWKMAFIFAVTGNVVYYGLEVLGIKMIGSPMVALLFATVPICVSLYGNFLEKEFPYSVLALPLCIVFAGVMIVHVFDVNIDPDITLDRFIAGVLITFSCIGMWVWYAVNNARFLRTSPVTTSDFNYIIGVWCFVISVVSIPAFLIAPGTELHFFASDLTRQDVVSFVVATAILGLVASWLGTYFWHQASMLLPTSLLGQLIVAEMILGLTYNYIINMRMPQWYEITGVLLVIVGVLASLRAVRIHKEQAIQLQ
ncbi:MAG: DMT family transporter, partial [Chlamydiia bacterium]|nr:DMT family transporter [Chlamydiia bacterium]